MPKIRANKLEVRRQVMWERQVTRRQFQDEEQAVNGETAEYPTCIDTSAMSEKEGEQFLLEVTLRQFL
ncbi:unnamed protein product [Linum trigynum]|uniref:Uncharacterized protein n=1 Tax=Linum trigynum TaxID=586398 RepID=A0AAV2GSM6_9ROSI